VAPRSRILAFGSAAALVVVGAICGLLVSGLTGEVLASALVTVGLGAVILLVFFEVGLSDDRAMAKEEERRKGRRDGSGRPRRRPTTIRPRRRP
jgi:NADH:ubiquinone oxidoreductase subunit 6 (subunit J)